LVKMFGAFSFLILNL